MVYTSFVISSPGQELIIRIPPAHSMEEKDQQHLTLTMVDVWHHICMYGQPLDTSILAVITNMSRFPTQTSNQTDFKYYKKYFSI